MCCSGCSRFETDTEGTQEEAMKTLSPTKSLLCALGCAVALGTLAFAPAARADDDEDEEEEDEDEREHDHRRSRGERDEPGAARPAAPGTATTSAPATLAPAPLSPEAAAYQAECSSCHLAYPPELLPARSWTRLMGGLDDHFGQNAELDAAARESMTRWLERNAAEHSPRSMARRVLRDSEGKTPLRISELRFIQREHDEVNPQVWRRPAVGSVANCAACHRGAEKGSFSEHDIRIPR